MNYYGIAICVKHTYISTARWGKDIAKVKDRAIDAAIDCVPHNDRLLEVKVVKAKTRKEVVDLYEC